MNFENYNHGEQVPVEDEKTDKLKNKIKKTVAIGSMVAGVLATEGCSPDKSVETKNDQPSHHEIDTGAKARSENSLSTKYHRNVERNKKINQMILENENLAKNGKIDFANNNFLKMYYQCIDNNGYVESGDEQIVREGMKMRVLEIAYKHKIQLDLSKIDKIIIESLGITPISAEINGVLVLINESDYTSKEIELLKLKQGVNQQENSSPIISKSKLKGNGTVGENIRTSPDFDKDADF